MARDEAEHFGPSLRALVIGATVLLGQELFELRWADGEAGCLIPVEEVVIPGHDIVDLVCSSQGDQVVVVGVSDGWHASAGSPTTLAYVATVAQNCSAASSGIQRRSRGRLRTSRSSARSVGQAKTSPSRSHRCTMRCDGPVRMAADTSTLARERPTRGGQRLRRCGLPSSRGGHPPSGVRHSVRQTGRNPVDGAAFGGLSGRIIPASVPEACSVRKFVSMGNFRVVGAFCQVNHLTEGVHDGTSWSTDRSDQAHWR